MFMWSFGALIEEYCMGLDVQGLGANKSSVNSSRSLYSQKWQVLTS